MVADPERHHWSLGQPAREVNIEIQAAMPRSLGRLARLAAQQPGQHAPPKRFPGALVMPHLGDVGSSAGLRRRCHSAVVRWPHIRTADVWAERARTSCRSSAAPATGSSAGRRVGHQRPNGPQDLFKADRWPVALIQPATYAPGTGSPVPGPIAPVHHR